MTKDEIAVRIDELREELDDLKDQLEGTSPQPPLKRVKDTKDFLCTECRKDGIDHPHCMMNITYKGRKGVCLKGHCIVEEAREARMTGKTVEPSIPVREKVPKKRKAYRLDHSGFDDKTYVRAIFKKRIPVNTCSESEARCAAFIAGRWVFFRRVCQLATFLERGMGVVSAALRKGEYRTIELKRVNQ